MVTPTEQASTSQEMKNNMDISAFSIQSRILPFWREHPRLWFAQFEALVEPSKCSDETKFRYVLGVLQQSDVQQISDILLNPPLPGKYAALKERLISVYQESESLQLQKLLAGQELGDQKPSQLLRRMRELGGSMVQDDALRVLWLKQMPTPVRTVLSINKESSLATLATMADLMLEQLQEPQIATISTSSHQDQKVDLLSKQIEKLSLEIAELRGRQNYRRPAFSRGRSRSNSTRRPGDADWLCRYHYRFRGDARKCESPCSWKKPQEKKSEN